MKRCYLVRHAQTAWNDENRIQGPAGVVHEVDARPSDSIAVALRADAPIFVAEDVLNQVASSYGGL